MKGVPSGGINVGQFAEKNQVKLKQLEQDRSHLQKAYLIAGLGGIAGFAFWSVSALATFPSLWLILGKLQTTSQRYLLMPDLITAFEHEDIEIEVGVEAEGTRPIDFFLRFPDRQYVLIQIQAISGAKVVYNEGLEALQYRQRNGSLKTWKPDPLLELVTQEQWIRKQRTEWLGVTARERKSPMAKVLLLWTDTQVGDLSEELYDRLNESKYVTIRRRSTFNVVPRDQIIDFIKDYLASRRSPKTP